MDYEEKYNKALERAKDMLAYKEVRQEDMEYLFPELEGSKDERIRKAIKKALQVRCGGSRIISDEPVTLEEAIAWLEKQGEEEYALKSFRDKDVHEFMQYIENQAKAYEFNLPNRGYDIYAFAKDILHWLEKQGEKKPNSQMEKCSKCQFVYTGYCDGTCILENNEQKSVDKVEPKFEPQFKVGNWITDGYIYYKITEILDDRYIIESKYDKRGAILFEYENRYHLWTIQDAKDGDVLVCDINKAEIGGDVEKLPNIIPTICIYHNVVKDQDFIHTYCSLYNESSLIVSNSMYYNTFVYNIHPATKEQRELLFEKMREAGYELDAEKKELKKIEVVSKESEDERIRKELIEQVAYIIPNDDEVDGEGNTLPTYQKRIDKYRAWLEKH